MRRGGYDRIDQQQLSHRHPFGDPGGPFGANLLSRGQHEPDGKLDCRHGRDELRRMATDRLILHGRDKDHRDTCYGSLVPRHGPDLHRPIQLLRHGEQHLRHIGQRVLCLRHHRRLRRVHATRGSNLTAATGTCTGVNLSWTAGTGTTNSYNVYRVAGACGGTYSKIAGPLVGLTYSDTSAVAGTSYAYVVRGACDAGV